MGNGLDSIFTSGRRVSELGNVIVGYPQGDPRIRALWEDHGRRALPHRGCLSCGVLCYFVESGVDAIRDRDPEVICERCRNRPDVWKDVMNDL
jgi:hypothetical protein